MKWNKCQIHTEVILLNTWLLHNQSSVVAMKDFLSWYYKQINLIRDRMGWVWKFRHMINSWIFSLFSNLTKLMNDSCQHGLSFFCWRISLKTCKCKHFIVRWKQIKINLSGKVHVFYVSKIMLQFSLACVFPFSPLRGDL